MLYDNRNAERERERERGRVKKSSDVLPLKQSQRVITNGIKKEKHSEIMTKMCRAQWNTRCDLIRNVYGDSFLEGHTACR